MAFEFLTPNLVAMGIVVAGIAYAVWRDRDKIERHSIMIIRRTDHGIEFLDRMAKRFPRLWMIWSSIGVLVGFLMMGYMFLYLFKSTLQILIAPQAVPSIGLVLPTASSQASFSPGVFFIPFWYWIVGIMTVMVVHEMMHGVIARNEGFPIKSVGWFIFAIIPGAFVEPEGEEMMPEDGDSDDPGESEAEQAADADEAEDGLFGTWGKGERNADDEEITDTEDPDMFDGPWGEGSWIGQLRVLAAGSGANLTVAALLFLLMFGLTTPAHGSREVRGIYTYEGVRIDGVFNDTVAAERGFKQGMLITRINNRTIRDLRDFSRATDNFSVNESVTIAGTYNGSDFSITARLGRRPEPNITYEPAPIDPALVWLEQRYPGTIETFERYNNLVVDSSVQTRLARWQWIQDEYGGLDARAAEHIDRLRQQLPEPGDEGFLGISIQSQPVTEPKEGMAMVAVLATILMKFLFFMILIHSGIGAANLLPAKPFDGGWMLSILVHRIRPAWEHPVTLFFTVTTILLIVFNIGFPLVSSLV